MGNIGARIALVGVAIVVGGIAMRLRITEAEHMEDYGKNGRYPRLRRFNHGAGQFGKWLAFAGVPVGIVGLLIWAFTA